jgi:beta-glucanase (GH16 family)
MELSPAEAFGATPLPASEEAFDRWESSRWQTGNHALGRGWVRPANVSVVGGQLLLSLPPGALDGAEVLTSRRVRYGSYEARLRAAAAPGSITAFFLYEGVRGGNDEVDIELIGGTPRVMFTVWVRGQRVHHGEVVLPFDPAADFHDYRIDHARNALRFYVDGTEVAQFSTPLPGAQMHVMANAWWPEWLEGGPYPSAHGATIEWIRY